MTIYDLKERREKLGITLEVVAAKVGVTPATISRWERGKMVPHRVMLREWSKALKRLATRRKVS